MTDIVDAPAALIEDPLPADATKKSLGWGFWLCVGWLGTLSLVALLAPILPIDEPTAFGAGPNNEGPSWAHWFGTDKGGRDVFARAVWGARISLVVGAFAIGFGLVVGGTLGMLAGYLRGWVDQIISFIFFTVLSFPALVLAILIVTSFERSLMTVSLTLGVLAVAPVGRLARAQTLVFAEREFVQAARVIGAKNGRIIVRELLPNVVIPMGALALLGMAVAIVAEGGLAFLGLSVQKEETWGKLILLGAGSRDLEQSPWISMAPIFVLFLTVLALNYAGDKVRAYFDVRESSL